jgi:3-methyladenine DNA glycosylase AlkD
MDELRRRGNPKGVAGMSRFGIQTSMALGVSIPQLRDVAKRLGTNHDLQLKFGRLEFMRHESSPA